jgi:hypothetical protein
MAPLDDPTQERTDAIVDNLDAVETFGPERADPRNPGMPLSTSLPSVPPRIARNPSREGYLPSTPAMRINENSQFSASDFLGAPTHELIVNEDSYLYR